MCSAKDSSWSKITPKSLTEVEKTKVGNSCVRETRSSLANCWRVPSRFTLNSARTFRRPSFQRTQLGAANHSAYSTRRDQIQRLHISATFISANTSLRFQTPGLLKSLNL